MSQPIKTTKLNWYSPKTIPKYQFTAAGNAFTNLLIEIKGGESFAGDYTNGKWYVLGVEFPPERIEAWCHYPSFINERY